MPIIAAVQINGSSNIEKNLASTERLVRAAAAAGAEFIATPEATTYLGPHDRKITLAEPLDGPTHQRLARLAADLSVTLLVGSVAERLDDTKAYNTSLLFGPDGSRYWPTTGRCTSSTWTWRPPAVCASKRATPLDAAQTWS